MYKIAALACIIIILSTQAYTQQFNNYLLPHQELADPCTIEFEGSYYMYPTGNAQSIKCFKSENLTQWQDIGNVFVVNSSTHNTENSPWKTNIFAPDVKYINGLFYMYYTSASPTSSETTQIGVAVSNTPQGPFMDLSKTAPLVGNGNSKSALDPHLFKDTDVKIYLYYVKYKKRFEIFVREMDSPSSFGNNQEFLCLKPKFNWNASKGKLKKDSRLNKEHILNEAPSVSKIRDKYYMFYAANLANSQNYHVGAAVSSTPIGPWAKQITSILEQDISNQAYGIGSGNYITGIDGISEWFVCHQKASNDISFLRYLSLNKLQPRNTANNAYFWSSFATFNTSLPAPRGALELEQFDSPTPPESLGYTSNCEISNGELRIPDAEYAYIQKGTTYGDSSIELSVKFPLITSPPQLHCYFTAELDPGIPIQIGWEFHVEQNTLLLIVTDNTNSVQLAQFNHAAIESLLTGSNIIKLENQGTRISAAINGIRIGTYDISGAQLTNYILIAPKASTASISHYKINNVIKDNFEYGDTQGTLTGGTWSFNLSEPSLDQLSIIGVAKWQLKHAVSNFDADFNITALQLNSSNSNYGVGLTLSNGSALQLISTGSSLAFNRILNNNIVSQEQIGIPANSTNPPQPESNVFSIHQRETLVGSNPTLLTFFAFNGVVVYQTSDPITPGLNSVPYVRTENAKIRIHSINTSFK